jgi:PKD repeat protein
MPTPGSRFARSRASLLAVSALAIACHSTDQLTSNSDSITDVPAADSGLVAFLNSSTGGMPFGFYHLPKELYGGMYTGALRGISPDSLLLNLEAARTAGANIVISLVGGDKNFKNVDGTFSLDLWKARLTPFLGIDFSSYVADGTIIGHYLMDEPNDPANWAGTPVSPATVEEMARYSKQLWPEMVTIIRTSPSYLRGRNYQYLDAAWAQYHDRFGAVAPWLDTYVRDARLTGLALIMGMNALAGGNSVTGLPGFYFDLYSMSAAQLESVGNAMMDDPYPCAFVSWKYHADYLARPDIQSALASLATRSSARPFKTCRGANQSPTAAFSPPSCSVGVRCQFTDGSSDGDGTIATWSWSFGDGTFSTQPGPSTTYSAAGPYSVTLTVTDNEGATSTASSSVTVTPANIPPTAAFISPTCRAGVPCQFNDGSSDSDGSIASRAWTFGDGTSSTQANPSKTYLAAGSYSVALIVTDNNGATSSASGSVTVTPANILPTAAFTSPACTAGMACQFNDGSSDSDGSIASRTWTFGDGTSSTQPNPLKTYAAAGSYSVTLRVTDNDAATSSVSHSLTVAPRTPPPGVTPIVLRVTGRVDLTRQYMTLTWTGMVGTPAAVFRDGRLITNTVNDGKYTNSRLYRQPITYVYKVCRAGTSTCSNLASVTFR